jgi:hypothetical protein
VDVVKGAQKEKVVRVGLLALRNLLEDESLVGDIRSGDLGSDLVDLMGTGPSSGTYACAAVRRCWHVLRGVTMQHHHRQSALLTYCCGAQCRARPLARCVFAAVLMRQLHHLALKSPIRAWPLTWWRLDCRRSWRSAASR